MVFLLIAFGLPLPGQAAPPDFSELKQTLRGFKPSRQETAAGAVVLKNEIEVDYKGDGLATSRLYFVISVLDEKAARDYTQIEHYFNSHYSELELDFARLIDADGNEYRVSGDAVQIKSTAEDHYYSDTRKLVFSLPSMRPGSTFEFQYTETMIRRPLEKGWYDFYWLHYLQSLPGGYARLDPVRDFSLTLKYPQGLKIYHKTDNSDVEPVHSMRGGHEYLVWSKRRLEGLEIEPYMPPITMSIPAVRMSTLRNWSELDESVARVYLDAAVPGPRLQALAGKIADKTESDIEKIKAVFYFLQNNVRYISADFKRGGITPHKADEVYGNRYGDCKDQTVLMVALLSALGIKAYPALTGMDPSPEVDHEIPSFSFSHMIVHVPRDGEDLWIDASGPPGLFPGIDWSVQGRYAFVLDGKGGALKRIPVDAPDKSLIKVRADFHFLKGAELAADFDIDMEGVVANRFKGWQLQNPQAGDDIKKIISRFYPAGVVESLKLPDEEAQAAYHIEATMRFPDYWKNDKEHFSIGGGLAPMLSAFTNMSSLLPGKRTHDFVLGNPMTLRFSVSAPAPGPDYVPVKVGADYEKQTDFFHARTAVTARDDRSSADSMFVLKKKTLPAAAYSGFLGDINEISEGSAWYLTYKLDKRLSSRQQLQSELEKNPDDVASLAKLIRHHLESGEYQQARTLADKAVVTHPKNGEIHYLLGVSLGFMGDYEKSSQLINESRALGFKP